MIEPPNMEILIDHGRRMIEDEEQMDPILFFNDPPDNKAVMMPCIAMHPTEGIAFIEAAIKQGITHRPDWIALITDSYHFSGERDEADKYVGSLKTLFEAGDTRVKEALVVHCISRIGVVYYAQRPYTRVADGFVWDDVQDFSMEASSIGGRVSDGMRNLVGAPDPLEDEPVRFD